MMRGRLGMILAPAAFLLVLMGCEFWGIGVDSSVEPQQYEVEIAVSAHSATAEPVELELILPSSILSTTNSGNLNSGDVLTVQGVVIPNEPEALRMEFTMPPSLAPNDEVTVRVSYILERKPEDSLRYYTHCLVVRNSDTAFSEAELTDRCDSPLEEPIIHVFGEGLADETISLELLVPYNPRHSRN